MKKILLTILFTCSCAGFSAAQADKYPLQVGDTDTISELNWSPDDRLILTSSGDDNALRLWEVASGRVLWKSDVSFLQDGTEIYTVRVSDWTRDLKFIVTGTSNGKLQLWEAETGRLVWNVKAHADTVTALATSPDGKMVVSTADAGDRKSELKVWGLSDGRLLKDLSPGQKDIRAVRFVAASRFQTGNGSGMVTTWSSDGFKAISTRRVFPCGAADQRRNSSVYSPISHSSPRSAGRTWSSRTCGQEGWSKGYRKRSTIACRLSAVTGRCFSCPTLLMPGSSTYARTVLRRSTSSTAGS